MEKKNEIVAAETPRKLRLNRESLTRLTATTADGKPQAPNTTGFNCSHPVDACN
jgi:hypothetical protein